MVIGIDPGKDGAVAMLHGGVLFDVLDTPLVASSKGKRAYDEYAMRELLDSYRKNVTTPDTLLVIIELVHAMPGQGVTSMFSMGEGLGLWRGLLVGLQIPYQLVTPQAWKKSILAGFGLKDKNASFQVASRLYPQSLLTGPRGGVKDGRADAVCLAEYGRRLRS